MTTRLDKTLRRELDINGRAFVVSISPEGLKLTLKGHRKGFELQWESLVSGDEALTVALNASVGQFAASKQTELTTQKKLRRSSTVKKVPEVQAAEPSRMRQRHRRRQNKLQS